MPPPAVGTDPVLRLEDAPRMAQWRHSFVYSAGQSDALLFSDSGPSLCTTGRDPLFSFFTFSSTRYIFYQHFSFHSCQSLTSRRQGLIGTGKSSWRPFCMHSLAVLLFRRERGKLWTAWFMNMAWHIEGSSCLSWNIWDWRDYCICPDDIKEERGRVYLRLNSFYRLFEILHE